MVDFNNIITDNPSSIAATDFASALSERYLAYALSTITSRSLPDVRDGLKPVHRRLLFAMRQLKLDPDQSYKKSARVVGDVIGKYHPHGDSAIYDAMVRLAQEFAMRYPLVDGQGNFGNIDGDNAAAMRYTEARLTTVSRLLLSGIDENAVDFRQTYDGESEEPILLPAGFPNLLANGAQGIAVGMATSIPPHNVLELVDAAKHLIKHPGASIEKLMDFVKGPDFPTGGVLVEPQNSILSAYQTGKGSFRLRSHYFVEKEKNGLWRIIVTEIPYQIQKSRLIEKLADALQQKKLPMLSDIRDESAEDVRILLEPKSRKLSPEAVMESLFQVTDLEIRIPLNLNVLDSDNKPNVLSLRQALQQWLEHRKNVLLRRAQFRLDAIAKRLEVVAGYLVVFLNLDEVIEIIREQEHPRDALMSRFALSEFQANTVLDMRLRSLRRLEEEGLKIEQNKLSAEQEELQTLKASEELQWQKINIELSELKAAFIKQDMRRTRLGTAPEIDFDPMEMLVEKEPVTVICSEKGWIRAMKGHLDLAAEYKFKEGDGPQFILHAETTDKLILFNDMGRFFTISCDSLPKGRGFGEPLNLIIDISANQKLIAMFKADTDQLLLASNKGYGLRVLTANVIAQTKNGKQILNLGPDERAQTCLPVKADMVASVGKNRKLLIFPVSEIPEIAKGRGVILQRFKEGDLADITLFDSQEGLNWQTNGDRMRHLTNYSDWVGKRGGAGKLTPNGFPRPARFT
ncbi:DNA topoisomerase IV subunit A [Alphaproteobacteria bacterium]|jgi:topoisomerase IV subunit A|nr:DNA topoisomerase IV subunit A [Alphaproteobacteria bacterium]MBT5799543.1 DNA topoisomerase IV subunit A [Alphaproteobacteria bacterium]MDC0394766.1 DNA topoisomerase IV subunit A [Alphaproteobacteria bacterium]MDC3311230.1 DNA topoisomerase IV subunit A [Alphaproteobacteria bacterium]